MPLREDVKMLHDDVGATMRGVLSSYQRDADTRLLIHDTSVHALHSIIVIMIYARLL